ncbi:MAG TPA: hypothetical protein VNN07_03390 [Candidatus Tectomicrobia bacterium]|nr:hypothetical protein [Candidatus Tectomicrobia bacterium]
MRLLALVVASLALVPACAATRQTIDQRTTQGPTAEQMFLVRIAEQHGRTPTFDERRHWDQMLEDRIAAYLRAHPERANALDVSTFRFTRRVAVGMDKEQVLMLLGPPVSTTTDQAKMEQVARGHWPAIKGNATEAWTYPLGYVLYFAGQRVVDITQYVGAD